MADFYGAMMCSSFRVRDRQVFLSDLNVMKLKAFVESSGFFESREATALDGTAYELWAFGYEGQYPSLVLDTEDGDSLEYVEILRPHLVPGDVVVLSVSGQEKLRYIGGMYVVLTADGAAFFDATNAWDESWDRRDMNGKLAAFLDEAKRAGLDVSPGDGLVD